MLSRRTESMLAWTVIVLALLGAGALVLAIGWGLDATCHRMIGPWITGTNDPVANAIFCTGGRR